MRRNLSKGVHIVSEEVDLRVPPYIVSEETEAPPPPIISEETDLRRPHIVCKETQLGGPYTASKQRN